MANSRIESPATKGELALAIMQTTAALQSLSVMVMKLHLGQRDEFPAALDRYSEQIATLVRTAEDLSGWDLSSDE